MAAKHIISHQQLKGFALRSTLVDIAQKAGVSTATVDRVLNNRKGVRAKTRNAVMEAAQALGYFGQDSAIVQAAQHELKRLDFILPAGTNAFIANLLDHLKSQATSHTNLDTHIHSIEGFNPVSLAETLYSLRGQTHGIGVVALDHPAVREAMRSLTEDGVKIVTIASDILHVPRVAYIGIDNRAAGRLAGYLLGRFLDKKNKQKIALFAGSLAYRGHEEREMGFRRILSEDFVNTEIVELREIHDDRQKAYEETVALLRRHPDLAGIYNIGAGNQGISQALKEHGLDNTIIFIGHELTEASRALLLDGTLDAIIDQNPRVEAREALSVLNNSIRQQDIDYTPPRLQVIFRENIPER